MSKTVAQRLIAGEHYGCATWAAVARQFGVGERGLRGVRALLTAQGRVVSLRPLSNIGKPDNSATDGLGDEFGATYRDADNRIEIPIPNDGSAVPNEGMRWPSVERFDTGETEPLLPVIPQRHAVKGVSSLVDGVTGEIRQQWIKTRYERDPIADITEAFASIKDGLPQTDAPIPAPNRTSDRLLAAYLLGDSHVGMHAWSQDAGSNFDLKIAERNLTGLVGHLVDIAPPAQRALIVNIGDYFHTDNRNNTTTRGTPVDVDGRWVKVLSVGIRIMRRIIDRALAKHDHVTVINEIGNHDTHASLFLSLALAQFYENEPRVHIDCSPEMFHWYRFGKVLIGTHHGHMVKPADLLGVMVSDRAQDWGETLWRYFFTGHIHHERSREFPGMLWRSLRASSTSDGWHRASGYRSAQELCVETFDIEDGLINRCMVGVPKDLGRAA